MFIWWSGILSCINQPSVVFKHTINLFNKRHCESSDDCDLVKYFLWKCCVTMAKMGKTHFSQKKLAFTLIQWQYHFKNLKCSCLYFRDCCVVRTKFCTNTFSIIQIFNSSMKVSMVPPPTKPIEKHKMNPQVNPLSWRFVDSNTSHCLLFCIVQQLH